MPGAVAIILALVIFPVVAIMGSAGTGVPLGFLLNRVRERRHERSGLLAVKV